MNSVPKLKAFPSAGIAGLYALSMFSTLYMAAIAKPDHMIGLRRKPPATR